jgi:hypothetical protein
VRLPFASALTGSVRRLEFVEHCVGTTNIGSRAPDVPLLYGVVREGPTATRTADALDQGADGDTSINKRSHS